MATENDEIRSANGSTPAEYVAEFFAYETIGILPGEAIPSAQGLLDEGMASLLAGVGIPPDLHARPMPADSFHKKPIPATATTRDELDRAVPTDKPVRVIDPEPAATAEPPRAWPVHTLIDTTHIVQRTPFRFEQPFEPVALRSWAGFGEPPPPELAAPPFADDCPVGFAPVATVPVAAGGYELEPTEYVSAGTLVIPADGADPHHVVPAEPAAE